MANICVMLLNPSFFNDFVSKNLLLIWVLWVICLPGVMGKWDLLEDGLGLLGFWVILSRYHILSITPINIRPELLLIIMSCF